MKAILRILILPLTLFLMASCGHQHDFEKHYLDGEWEFKQLDSTTWMPATVPGTIHTDLMENGVIEDPFYRLNEQEVQWVDKVDWEYKTTFKIDERYLQNDAIKLHFDGLDTWATVYLNGVRILQADNMFYQWEVAVKALLKEGKNTLRILFHSPINKGLELREALGYELPGAENDQSQRGGTGDLKTVVFSRKAQYHFGWDWGPRLVTGGIWQPVYLTAHNTAQIQQVQFHQKSLTEEKATLDIHIQVESFEEENVAVAIFRGDAIVAEKSFDLTTGTNGLTLPITLKNPEWWWPNGLGTPHLYDFKITLNKNNRTIDRTYESIGLRTIALVQEPDEEGSSFYFKVNGRPLFMKGANYIPQDIFLPRVSPEDYEHLIQSAAAANFNMLRVWGGGIYEQELFYDLCDQYGILVWQDFMFACAMYPGNPAFLTNVEKEARQNVQRLRNHPCIALWCGDNEILSAWNRWGWKETVIEHQGEAIADTIWKAYDTIMHEILPAIVKKHDPERPYWGSSPSAGLGQLENGKSGDNHYWGVWWAKEPFEKYKEEIPRFMSEYGFQSFPELNSVKNYTQPEDWDIESAVMRSHQRSSIGNGTIKEYMERDYRTPKDFPLFLYVNHVLQAEGIRTAMEAHRRHMPHCMGSLYWQLNDCWPVASWSGIDYYGQWKALHYFAKKAFNTVLVSPDLDTLDNVTIHLVSDLPEPQKAILTWKLVDFEGNIRKKAKRDITIPANSAQRFFKTPAKQLLPDSLRQNHLLAVTVEDMEGNPLSKNILYFDRPKNLALPQPGITWTAKKKEETLLITIQAQRLAKNLYLQAEMEGDFSDNYFDLLPGEERTLTFTPDNRFSEAKATKGITLISMVDSFEEVEPEELPTEAQPRDTL
ncbi:MAG: beta-mannosidase [Bacteroidetes bacterium]|nr:MAG: beta-mannosidase [Bacteroidota bacterium]PIE87863.1 MAG: beta-mannosidase [Bacteroidota bacterium]